MEYVYDAGGNKLRKIVRQNGVIQSEQDYVGGLEYRKIAAGSRRVESLYHTEGRYYNLNAELSNTLNWRKEYHLRDHLGNTRLTFADKNNNGIVDVTNTPATNEILQEMHYYPFGLAHEGPWLMNDAARDDQYKYNGKEWDETVGWYDYGARWYDPAVGRWGQVDALADHPNQVDKSPYAYAWNNPVLLDDPDGQCPLCPIIKGAAGAGIDYFLQGVVNYATGMPADQAWKRENIDLSDVAWSGITGALLWTAPGGKYAKAAAVAFSDVAFNFAKAEWRREDYTLEQAGTDFLIGFIAQLGAERV